MCMDPFFGIGRSHQIVINQLVQKMKKYKYRLRACPLGKPSKPSLPAINSNPKPISRVSRMEVAMEMVFET